MSFTVFFYIFQPTTATYNRTSVAGESFLAFFDHKTFSVLSFYP